MAPNLFDKNGDGHQSRFIFFKLEPFKGVQTYVAMVILVAMHCSIFLSNIGLYTLKAKVEVAIKMTLTS